MKKLLQIILIVTLSELFVVIYGQDNIKYNFNIEINDVPDRFMAESHSEEIYNQITLSDIMLDKESFKCKCLSDVSSQKDSSNHKRIWLLLGGQIEGSTILSPMIGLEFAMSQRWSLRTTSTLAFHYFYKSLGYEYIQLFRVNYQLWHWLALSTGPGISYIFNPKYNKNPYDPRFVECGLKKCPVPKFSGIFDFGLQLAPFRKVPFQLNALFDIYGQYQSGINVPLKYELLGPVLRIELNYKFL